LGPVKRQSVIERVTASVNLAELSDLLAPHPDPPPRGGRDGREWLGDRTRVRAA